MTVRSRRILGAAASAAVLAVVVVATFVGVSLVAGGGDDEPQIPQAALDSTPPPPSGPVPTQDPNLPPRFTTPTPGPTPKGPESVEVSGVVIPIPEGAQYRYGGAADGRPIHQIWFGGANFRETDSGRVAAGIQFDESGLLHAYFEGSQEDALAPALDALWVVAQAAGTPSPPSVSVKGVDVPLPPGSYYTTIETPLYEENLVTYLVRSEHSVLVLDGNGVVSSSVRPSDEAKFQATLDAIDILASAD